MMASRYLPCFGSKDWACVPAVKAAVSWREGGARIARSGSLPLNTNGGQLSAGRTHGLGYVHEACLQLWGRAGERQIAPHQIAVAAAGGGPLGGSLLLVRQ